MWIKQQIYTFKVESFKPDIELDSISLNINERKTTIKINQLFAKISSVYFSNAGNFLNIKGWSILQYLVDNKLKIGEKEINISFESNELGKIKIFKIENPWFMFNDIELSDDETESINSKLIELSEPGSDVDESEDDRLPHTSPSDIVNESYESGKKSYISIGYKEYIFENFRFLLNEKNNKAILIELVDEKKLIQLKNFKKIVDCFYKFEDKSRGVNIDVKIIDENLEVTLNYELAEDEIDKSNLD